MKEGLMKFISKEQLIKIIPNRISLPVGRKLFVMKRESPHIFFALGIAGTLVSTVLACRATLKLSETLDGIEKDITDAKKTNDTLSRLPIDIQPEANEYRKDLVYVYARGAVKLGRLYGPSVVVGVVSIGALTGSHVQLTRRNTALMAAYAAIERAFSEYRERIREEYGEEKESDIYHGLTTKTIVGDDGEEKQIKVADPSKYSLYARFFDESSSQWRKDPEYNRLYIDCQQNYANDLLHSRGHVFLNEVYDMLGLERSQAGQAVGWILNGEGDNYISFGIFEVDNARFVNGIERSILLDFNVDGKMYDKI